MMTAADLAAIRARADAATPGPWDFDTVDVPDVYFSDGNERHGYRSYTVYEDKPDGKTIVDATNSDGGTIEEEYDADGVDAWDETARRNAAFIAGSRQDIPALLAHIDALTARVAELDAGQRWRSMDTAPRDGTKFIAINKYGDVTYPVKWDDDCQMWVEYGLDGFDTMDWVRADRPDLWAPIPKPPPR